MAIYKGSQLIDTISFGNTPIASVYAGSTLVYEAIHYYTLTVSPTPSTASVTFNTPGTVSGKTITVPENTNVSYSLTATNFDPLSCQTLVTQNTTQTVKLYRTKVAWSSSSQRILYNWYAVEYNGSVYVVLDKTGQIVTLTDLTSTSWTITTSIGGTNTEWHGIAWGNNRFVAIDRRGWVTNSSDGSTWATKVRNANLFSVFTTTAPVNQWYDIIYDGSRFVALASAGYLSTSTDGETWAVPFQNSTLSNAGTGWQRLKWDGTRYIALSYYGDIAYSTNLTNWTLYKPSAIGSNSVWRAMIVNVQSSYHKYLIFQGITTGTIYTTGTTDITSSSSWSALQSWTNSSSSNTTMVHEWRDGIYTHNNKYVMIGESGWVAIASPY